MKSLAELADGGKVLEFAIGTGRVALPLAASGLSVYGIEASAAMVEQHREKPGGQEIPTIVGDMATAHFDEEFDLVFLVFNTIFNLTTQEAQIQCFHNAARHLKPGGLFVVETVVPDFSEYTDGRRTKGSWVTMEAARFEVAIHDRVAQTVGFQRIVISEDGIKMKPHFMRYVWPSEMDLMGKLAGLELHERWAWWDRSTFDSDSKSHISLYKKPE